MAKIIVLEDEASTRLLISSVLKKQGHEVIDLDNGAEGLLVILAEQPDLVISDVQMPKMTGFEVVAQMRQTADVADTPVILLTSLSSRADMRTGMSQGADDYITKPFEPAELLESVAAQLARAQQRQSTLDERAQALALSKIAQIKQAYEQQLAQTTLALKSLASNVSSAKSGAHPGANSAVNSASNHTANHAPAELPSRHFAKAWAMHVTVQNQEQFTDKLSARDWRLLLRSLYSPTSEASALKTASYVDLSGSDLLLVFGDAPSQSNTAQMRAVHAVADMVEASLRCKRWAASHFAQAQLPALRTAISLHAGPVDMASVPLQSGGQREVVLGCTIDQTLALRSSNPSLMWIATASEEALAGTADLLRIGASQQVSASGKDIRVYALMGLGAAAGASPQTPLDAAGWV